MCPHRVIEISCDVAKSNQLFSQKMSIQYTSIYAHSRSRAGKCVTCAAKMLAKDCRERAAGRLGHAQG